MAIMSECDYQVPFSLQIFQLAHSTYFPNDQFKDNNKNNENIILLSVFHK